jgi:uncharacterized protein YacL
MKRGTPQPAHQAEESSEEHPGTVLRLDVPQQDASGSGASAEPFEDPGPENRHRRVHGRERARGSHWLLIEFVRLIMVSMFAVAGWEVAVSVSSRDTPRLLIGIVVGSGIGYVLGGMFGRSTASAVSELEREFRRVAAAEILSGSIGLVLGLALATLLSFPLFHLPAVSAYPAIAFLYATAGYLGYKVGRTKSDELFALFGVKPKAAGMSAGEVSVLDSSAILDGRMLSLVRMGFLTGSLLVTQSVLDELQAVADSSNPNRRNRGRRALDLLIALKRDPSAEVVLVEDVRTVPGEAVDAQLVRLAKRRGGAIVTNDAGLAKVAAALDVPVKSIHALAEALRPPVVSGEQILVRLNRRGRERGQAVGYLDDGTMVVVEEADHLLGDTVKVTVTNAIQTTTGQMVFGEVAGAREASTP